jgi:multidrug resistance efflux pump
MSAFSSSIQVRLRRMRFLIFAAAFLVVPLIAAIVLLLPVDEKVPATGVVRAQDDVHVFSPQDGLLAAIRCPEGTAVKKGDILFELDSILHTQRAASAAASLAEAEATLRLKEAQLQKTSGLPLPKEFWHVPEELKQANERLALAERECDRYETLSKTGGASRQDYDRSLAQREVSRGEVEKIQEKLDVLSRGYREQVIAEAEAETAAAKAVVGRWKVERDNAAAMVERCLIRAPEDGIITLVEKRRPGMSVGAGEKLAHISRGPANRVKIFLAEEKIIRVAAGQEVIMRPLSIPWFKYGHAHGILRNVSTEPSFPESVPGGVRRYEAMVDVTESPVALAIGSTVDADVILRRRPMWQLLLPAVFDRE